MYSLSIYLSLSSYISDTGAPGTDKVELSVFTHYTESTGVLIGAGSASSTGDSASAVALMVEKRVGKEEWVQCDMVSASVFHHHPPLNMRLCH